jgi:N-acetyl-alpha-D-muramate 1-phosphate uridylyltransferase
MLAVAILAGGLATRLRPLTDRVPKSLLEIAGRPFIFHQLEMLRNEGVDRVVLCVGHLGEQIRAVVGDGRTHGIAIDYSFDGNELLGTGGALRRALPVLGAAFFVLNGDSYLRCPLARIQSAFEASGRPALMTVLRNDNRWERSNVLYRNGEIIEYDKHSPRADMAHVDFGLSVLSSAVFAPYAAAKVIDLADICQDLSRSGLLAAFEVMERFYEIGSLQGIADTEEFLSRKRDNV